MQNIERIASKMLTSRPFLVVVGVFERSLGTYGASGTSKTPVTVAEYFATYMENQVREELGQSLRTFYHAEQEVDIMGTILSTYKKEVEVYDTTQKLHIKSSTGGIIKYYEHKFK